MNHLIATRERRRYVQRPSDRLCGPRHAPRLCQDLGRTKQGLGRHACVKRALTTDELRLNHRDAATLAGELAGNDLPRRASADHNHVERFDAHDISHCVMETRLCPLARVVDCGEVIAAVSRGDFALETVVNDLE